MEIATVGVVGLGTMGAGIAQVCVQAGVDTLGREVTPELAERGRATIERYLARGVEKERLTQDEMDVALDRLRLATDLDALGECDLVIEAIVEQVDAKKELFATLERVVSPEAILALSLIHI